MSPVAVNVRGTSGSGKTTLVRRLIALAGPLEEYREEGKLLGYWSPLLRLFVVGAYEPGKQTGGCDRIRGRDEIFRVVRLGLARGGSVLFEGLTIRDEFSRTTTLGVPTHVVALTTSLAGCVAAINERRARRGVTEPVDPHHCAKNLKEVAASVRRLRATKVCVWELDREAAFLKVCELLTGGEA